MPSYRRKWEYISVAYYIQVCELLKGVLELVYLLILDISIEQSAVPLGAFCKM